jgi:general secretion pathway protein G
MHHAPDRTRRRRTHDAGFTLIELLVVLVILGLLAALAGPRVLNYLSGAKVDATRLQIKNLDQALDLFRFHTGNFPTTQQGLQALIADTQRVPGWNGPYLAGNDVPKDPWGTPYSYRSPGQHGSYDLISLGSDQTPGGQGDAADIASDQR